MEGQPPNVRTLSVIISSRTVSKGSIAKSADLVFSQNHMLQERKFFLT
jgi:hypothetical protein